MPERDRLLLRRGRLVDHDLSPRGSAVAVEGGRIVWCGDERTADAWQTHATRVIDLAGALVTPAPVDAHVHLAETGFGVGAVDLRGAVSSADALARIAHHVRSRPTGVVLGHGWDESRWPDRRFGADELQRACDGRPAYVSRVDAHSAVVSTALVERLPGLRSAAGWSPDGWVRRDAHHLARAGVAALQTHGDRREAIRSALRSARAAGLAAVHELGAPHLSEIGDVALVAEVSADEPMPTVSAYWGADEHYDDAAALGLAGLAGLAGDFSCDGAIGSHTAALRAPYADHDGVGHLYLDADRVRDHVVGCARAGLQAGFHVIGDRALDAVLDGFESAARLVGVDVIRHGRHRLEHVEMVDARALRRLGALGLGVSLQPAFDLAWGGPEGLYAERVGPERAAAMNPLAALHAALAHVAYGSDAPVTPFAPWTGIRAAVHHRHEPHRVAPAVALHAHTLAGWRLAGRDDVAGLTVGAPATLAAWDVEPSAEPWTEPPYAPEPRCTMSMVDGRVLQMDP